MSGGTEEVVQRIKTEILEDEVIQVDNEDDDNKKTGNGENMGETIKTENYDEDTVQSSDDAESALTIDDPDVLQTDNGEIVPLPKEKPASYSRRDRLLLRPWLIQQIDSGRIEGLEWISKDKMLFKIPWRHRSLVCYKEESDASLFEAWAVHTGRHVPNETVEDPKRWKANFRCALNSRSDIVEVLGLEKKSGCNAFRVYRFLEEQPKVPCSEKKKHHKLVETVDSTEASVGSLGLDASSLEAAETLAYLAQAHTRGPSNNNPGCRDNCTSTCRSSVLKKRPFVSSPSGEAKSPKLSKTVLDDVMDKFTDQAGLEWEVVQVKDEPLDDASDGLPGIPGRPTGQVTLLEPSGIPLPNLSAAMFARQSNSEPAGEWLGLQGDTVGDSDDSEDRLETCTSRQQALEAGMRREGGTEGTKGGTEGTARNDQNMHIEKKPHGTVDLCGVEDHDRTEQIGCHSKVSKETAPSAANRLPSSGQPAASVEVQCQGRRDSPEMPDVVINITPDTPSPPTLPPSSLAPGILTATVSPATTFTTTLSPAVVYARSSLQPIPAPCLTSPPSCDTASKPDSANSTDQPIPGVASGSQPIPGVACESKPIPGVASGSQPIPGVASESKPIPGVASESKPIPGVASGSQPIPGVASGSQPIPGVASESKPIPGVASGSKPIPGVASESKPIPGVSSESQPIPGVSSGSQPHPGAASGSQPSPSTPGSSSSSLVITDVKSLQPQGVPAPTLVAMPRVELSLPPRTFMSPQSGPLYNMFSAVPAAGFLPVNNITPPTQERPPKMIVTTVYTVSPSITARALARTSVAVSAPPTQVSPSVGCISSVSVAGGPGVCNANVLMSNSAPYQSVMMTNVAGGSLAPNANVLRMPLNQPALAPGQTQVTWSGQALTTPPFVNMVTKPTQLYSAATAIPSAQGLIHIAPTSSIPRQPLVNQQTQLAVPGIAPHPSVQASSTSSTQPSLFLANQVLASRPLLGNLPTVVPLGGSPQHPNYQILPRQLITVQGSNQNMCGLSAGVPLSSPEPPMLARGVAPFSFVATARAHATTLTASNLSPATTSAGTLQVPGIRMPHPRLTNPPMSTDPPTGPTSIAEPTEQTSTVETSNSEPQSENDNTDQENSNSRVTRSSSRISSWGPTGRKRARTAKSSPKTAKTVRMLLPRPPTMPRPQSPSRNPPVDPSILNPSVDLPTCDAPGDHPQPDLHWRLQRARQPRKSVETKVKALVSVLKAPASKAVTTAIASLGLGSSSEEGTYTSGEDNASHQQDTNTEDTNTSPGDKEVNEPRPASLVTSAGPLPAADSVGIGRSVVLRLAENAAKPSAGDRNRRCSFMLRQAPLLRALQQELISTKGAAPAALDSSMSKLLQSMFNRGDHESVVQVLEAFVRHTFLPVAEDIKSKLVSLSERLAIVERLFMSQWEGVHCQLDERDWPSRHLAPWNWPEMRKAGAIVYKTNKKRMWTKFKKTKDKNAKPSHTQQGKDCSTSAKSCARTPSSNKSNANSIDSRSISSSQFNAISIDDQSISHHSQTDCSKKKPVTDKISVNSSDCIPVDISSDSGADSSDDIIEDKSGVVCSKSDANSGQTDPIDDKSNVVCSKSEANSSQAGEDCKNILELTHTRTSENSHTSDNMCSSGMEGMEFKEEVCPSQHISDSQHNEPVDHYILDIKPSIPEISNTNS